MAPPIKQSTFSGGEITPSLFARTDHALYDKSLRTLRNMFCMRHGGVTGRPGTMYVGTTLNGGAQVRLLPFIFNETGLGQSYLLEFGNNYIAFYQNGGVVVSGGNPYTIVSPYAQADLALLQFAQCADIVTITHPNYPIYELKRLGATNWTITSPTFGAPIAGPTIYNITGTAQVGHNVSYYVSSLNSANEESDVVTLGTGIDIQIATLTNPVSISWTLVPGAVTYRIYGKVEGGNQYGFLGLATTPAFIDTGIVPDFTQRWPLNPNPFASPTNYPTTVGFAQQRRCFANTITNPIGFWMSQPGDFYNFNVHLTPTDSDAVIGSIAGEEVNQIQALLELKFMLMMTTGAEIYMQGNGSGVITPSSVNASVQSQYGCGTLRPLKVGDVLLFNQALGSFIRDFAFDFAIDGYRGNDVTVFAAHLFEGYQLLDWTYQKTPDSLVWAVRNDGTLLCCTYIREQQVLAWSRHDFTNGLVENVCAIPENGEYTLYLSIKRVINGQTVRYIERMSSRIWTDVLNATYLDCFSSYNGTNQGATTMTLTASGSFLDDDTAYQQQLTLTASGAFFSSNMVGNQIVFTDEEWTETYGAKGNQVMCTIQAYISTTQVTVTPSGAVPSEFQNTPVTTWSRAVKTLTGLNYLAGQEVSVWADRYVVGSPLNYHIKTIYTVALDGTLTLDKPYSVIYVGLPMVQDFQTLDLETSFGETILAKRKRQAKLGIYLLNTRTLFAGSEDPDKNLDNVNDVPLFQLYELKTGTSMVRYDQPPHLATDQDYIIEETRYNKNGRIFIRNVDPTPLTILAVSPQGDSAAPSPFYEKV